MSEIVCIKNSQCPGDFIVLSAALRDIALQYPGRFQLYASTLQPDIFQGNPYVGIGRPRGARVIQAKYSSPRNPHRVHRSNQHRAHFMWGFLSDLNLMLGTQAVLSDFRPALYLTEEEKAVPLLNLDRPYWVFVAGGKRDFTAKWWDQDWWQIVTNRLSKKVVMVQVGGGSHIHPRMEGAHDLVAKTSFRELMRLIYHSHGVLCIVTCLAHIAAAFNKPCVVVAGSRETWQWEAYNTENRLTNMRIGVPNWQPPKNDTFIPHQYLRSECTQPQWSGGKGCWKSKIDGKGNSCRDIAAQPSGRRLPRCLQVITPDMVVDGFEWYYKEGILSLDKKLIVPPIEPAVAEPEIKPMTPPAALHAPPAAPLPLPRPAPTPVDMEDIHLIVHVTSDTQFRYLMALKEHSPRAAITAACDGSHKGTAGWCERNAIGVVIDEKAPGRLEMLSQALDVREREHTVWLEPPVKPRIGYWSQCLTALKKGDAGGCLYWKRISDGELQLARAVPGGEKRAPAKHPVDNKPVTTYPHRGYFVLPREALERVHWLCRHVPDREFEVVLGAALEQWGMPVRELGHTVEHL